MIEYLYDTIRAAAGDYVDITAEVKDDNGNNITEGVVFMLYDNEEKLLISVNGDYINGEWAFHLPIGTLPKGKYFYSISADGVKLCFNKRFYLV